MRGLLEKTRAMGRLVQKLAGQPEEFKQIARVLSNLIGANVYIVNTRGKVLGYTLSEGFECGILREEVLLEERFPSDYAEALLRVDETHPNVAQTDFRCIFRRSDDCIEKGKVSTVVPISAGGERLGTLLVARFGQRFDEVDLVLAEFAATVVGMEMLRVKAERAEEEARKKAAVQVALGTLSYSELEAVQHIFEELGGQEGLLVASKIADRVGITRSVIVNALRKFESAGVIESRSLGMKGTYIKVLNERLLDELKKLR
ncbi:MAG: GTP-sensing pleiotropic transcriptional regulator CodY [bacterium]|nr:GTP-sensing pleiotropic transcriptional regulator CodY [bacterium]